MVNDKLFTKIKLSITAVLLSLIFSALAVADVSVSMAPENIDEDSGVGGFSVIISPPESEEVSIIFDSTGLADLGVDFQLVPVNSNIIITDNVITVPANTGGFDINVVPIDDNLVEDDEEVVISILSAKTVTGGTAVPIVAASDTAEFIIIDNDLTVTLIVSGEYGTITAPDGTIVTEGAQDVVVAKGESPVFNIATNDCFHISSVSPADSSLTYSVDFENHSVIFDTIQENQVIEVAFEIDEWNVTAEVVGQMNGSVTIDGELGTGIGTATLSGCADITYIVESNEDYHISHIKVIAEDGTQTSIYPVSGGSVGFNVARKEVKLDEWKEDITLQVAFTQHLTVIEESEYGSIQPAPEDGNDYIEVAYNAKPTFLIEAAERNAPDGFDDHTHHHISSIIIDGVEKFTELYGKEWSKEITFEDPVTADSTLEVLFTSFIDVTTDTLGKVSLTDEYLGTQIAESTGSSIEFRTGQEQILEFQPNEGHRVLRIKINNKNYGQIYDFDLGTLAEGNYTLSAEFKLARYVIEPSSTNGTIYNNAAQDEPATTKNVKYGSNVSYFVDLNNPNHGIESVIIDGLAVVIPAAGAQDTSNPSYVLANEGNDYLRITFTNVDTSHRIVVIDYKTTPLADLPLVANSNSADPNIVFVIDDSGSMNWSTMVKGVNGGAFRVGNSYYYGIFYDPPGNQSMLPYSRRMYWKSQWYEYNKMYYNPGAEYVPWPKVAAVSQSIGLSNSDQLDEDDVTNIVNPRLHPLESSATLNLAAEFDRVVLTPGAELILDDGWYNSGFSYSGSWTWERNYDAYSNDHWYTNSTAGSKTATWRFTVPQTGEYDIFIAWERHGRYVVDPYGYWDYVYYNQTVPYTITSNSIGTRTYQVDQGRSDGSANNGKPRYLLNRNERFSLQEGEILTVQLADTFNSRRSSSIDATMLKSPQEELIIPNAHYYVWSKDVSNGGAYLVIFDFDSQAMRYFKVGNNEATYTFELADANEQVRTISEVVNPPDDVAVEDYDSALENFANWVTYYRERRLTAIAAISRSLIEMERVRVGFRSLNNSSFNRDVVPIQVAGDANTLELLKLLYQWPASGATPLRLALENTGKYFDRNVSENNPDYSPYLSADEGGECQQSFAILMTDGFYNASSYYGYSGPSGTYRDDNSLSPPYGNAGTNGSIQSNRLSDIALHFYNKDLQPDTILQDRVPTSPDETQTGNDPASHQHMVTYAVSFGLEGDLEPSSFNMRSGSYPVWPYVYDNDPTTIDDLWHATVNGRGQFFSADTPESLVRSIQSIVNNIGNRTKGGASVSINGDELYETVGEDIRLYQSRYFSGQWYGDVRSYELVDEVGGTGDSDGNGVKDTYVWSASDKMKIRTSSRGVFTYNNYAGVDQSPGRPFTWDNISAIQKKQLVPYFAASRNGLDVMNYIGGDTTHEGTVFRSRSGPLGDFVNSQIEYEGDVVYVGGNDGMLHAFVATDTNGGHELFSYIPGLVYQDLRELSNVNYDHRFYVDNSPYVGTLGDSNRKILVSGLGKGGKGYFGLDVTNVSATNLANNGGFTASDVLWEFPAPPRVLVDGSTSISFSNPTDTGYDLIIDNTGTNFSGVDFAVGSHITVIGADCPAEGGSNNGIYEITGRTSNTDGNGNVNSIELQIADGNLLGSCGDGETITITKAISDPGIGYSYSDARILKTYDEERINKGTDYAGYVVVFGNGYDSEDGTAQLYVLNPVSGELIKKIDTGVGPANGLSSPAAVDVHNDLKIDYVYAGDLLGNMWKFDFTSDNYNDWQIAFCEGSDQTDHCNALGATPQPLFTAKTNQPITAAPDVTRHPDYQGYLVVFGTGKFLGQPDMDNTYMQSLYGIWDWAPDAYNLGYHGARIDKLEDVNGNGRLDDGEDRIDKGIVGIIDALTSTTLSNSPRISTGGNPLNTLLRQEILAEGLITEDADGDNILDDFEDVDGEGGGIQTYSYYRIITAKKPDWSVERVIWSSSNDKFYVDANDDGKIDTEDYVDVPQGNLGWYFDLPGKLMGPDHIDNDNDGTIDESGERSIGERVTSDTIIRDGKAIFISYGVTGSICDVSMFSFLNERDVETGGRYQQAIYDINNDGKIDETDAVMIYENSELVVGYPSDVGVEGQAFNPVILTDPNDPEVEWKIMSTSDGAVTTVKEKAERRGVYYWHQIE